LLPYSVPVGRSTLPLPTAVATWSMPRPSSVASQVNEFIASQTALGRAGLPGDVGPVIAALLSESHGWVNGQRIEVSGGWFL
jgi:NAD(P)-dependent dehydrogenase (short-subunit alcohol dehydrogenase family)